MPIFYLHSFENSFNKSSLTIILKKTFRLINPTLISTHLCYFYNLRPYKSSEKTS